jgi:hypothetical protein
MARLDHDPPIDVLHDCPIRCRDLGAGAAGPPIVTPERASPQELPTWRIPNVPPSVRS